MLALQPVVANREDAVMPYIYLNNAMVLARYFDKRENMKQQPGAYWHPGYPLLYFGITCSSACSRGLPDFIRCTVRRRF